MTISNRLFCDQRGNVAVLFAVALPLVIAAVGAGVDYGRLSLRRTQLQNNADTAAQAGAKVLSSSYGQADAARVSTATQAVGAFASRNAPNASVTTAVSLSARSVSVEISEPLNLIFGGVLGRQASTVGVNATAVYKLPPTCISALGVDVATGIKVEGSASIESPNCTVWSNTPTSTSIVLSSSGSITAGKVCAVGGGSGGGVRPTLETYCQPTPDPFAGRNLSSGALGCDYWNKELRSSATILPGVYCGGLKIQGSVTITMSPGRYEIRGGPFHVQGNGTVNGSGVSILLGSGAYLDYQGSPNVSIAAMTTGPLAGLAIASDPSTPVQQSTILGNSSTILTANTIGSIYLRNHTLSVGGSSDLVLNASPDLLAVRALVVSGSGKVKSVTNLSTRPEIVMTQ